MVGPLRRGVFPNRLHKIRDGDVTVSNAGSNILSLKIKRRDQRLGTAAASRAPSTTLKIAVFAPMPGASVSTATAVKPGFFTSIRNANLESAIIVLFSQSSHRAVG